ncbi:MAG: hypothetical protein U0136_05205 [Bdellovibrionota bacterium]
MRSDENISTKNISIGTDQTTERPALDPAIQINLSAADDQATSALQSCQDTEHAPHTELAGRDGQNRPETTLEQTASEQTGADALESSLESEESELSEPVKSDLSSKLDRLKSATLKVVHARERLPQPLFWSLFHAELDSIKRKRKKQRELLAATYNVDWL